MSDPVNALGVSTGHLFLLVAAEAAFRQDDPESVGLFQVCRPKDVHGPIGAEHHGGAKRVDAVEHQGPNRLDAPVVVDIPKPEILQATFSTSPRAVISLLQTAK